MREIGYARGGCWMLLYGAASQQVLALSRLQYTAQVITDER